jgi:hypothetical protein
VCKAFLLTLCGSMPLVQAAVRAEAAKPICATCHPRETAAFLSTSMSRSITTPEVTAPGRVAHELSDSVIGIDFPDRRMRHTLFEKGLTAAFPITYQIGSGKRGRSYAVELHKLFVGVSGIVVQGPRLGRVTGIRKSAASRL